MTKQSSILEKYALRELPYTPDADPRYTFLSCSFRNILQKADYVVAHGLGPLLVYGEPGTGKTILARILWQRFADRPDATEVLMTCEDFPSPNRFLRTLLSEFRVGKTAKAMEDSYAIFIDFLKRESGEGRRPVLVLDHAERLSRDDLLLLARLDAERLDGDRLLSCLLFGQLTLLPTVEWAVEFRERVSIQSYQESLSYDEALEMLQFEWRLAGGHEFPFEEAAVQTIYELSHGNAREINRRAAEGLAEAKGREVAAKDIH